MFNDLTANNQNFSGRARIKVIGVGGAGNNAVNRMLDAGINCAEYYVVNTDSQILALSPCENKIQIGGALTKGLGAGADPDVGRAAAEESKEQLTKAEGKKRMENTAEGLENLKKYVDTLIIIPNDKIKTVVAKNTPMREALRVADEILKQGIKGLAELIVNPSLINLDFADVRTILKDKGVAHLGVGVSKGDNRIIEAVRLAVNCPLLETTIEGARGVILNVVGGDDLTFDEVADAAELVRSVVDASANIIFGARIDPNVRDEVEITVIATSFPGFDSRREEDSTLRNYQSGRIYDSRSYNTVQSDRMSVNEPYYNRQSVQQPVQQQPAQHYQPIQPQQSYQSVQQQAPQQPYQIVQQQGGRPVPREEDSIERPNEKNVPKFAQLLRNLGKKRND